MAFVLRTRELKCLYLRVKRKALLSYEVFWLYMACTAENPDDCSVTDLYMQALIVEAQALLPRFPKRYNLTHAFVTMRDTPLGQGQHSELREREREISAEPKL